MDEIEKVSGNTCNHIPMQGLTCWKQALVKSPNRANELCRTSGILSFENTKIKRPFFSKLKLKSLLKMSHPNFIKLQGWTYCGTNTWFRPKTTLPLKGHSTFFFWKCAHFTTPSELNSWLLPFFNPFNWFSDI